LLEDVNELLIDWLLESEIFRALQAVDLYVAISSCLPKGGQILSVGIYPSEHGLKCMEIEAARGPSALIDNKEENSEDESESDDEDLRNEKLRTYELNKLRFGGKHLFFFEVFSNCCCFYGWKTIIFAC